MRAELLQVAADLAGRGEPFVLALVVRREPASSAQVGNMAIVTGDGQFHGWLGGSCIRPTVIREAAVALRDDAPRLIALSPDPDAARRPGVTALAMTCHSGGSVEIYLEPVMPAPRLLVFGASPTAAALARLGKAMGYGVDVVGPDANAASFPEADRVMSGYPPTAGQAAPARRGRLFAVVATLGERDEDAAREALAAQPAYLGVVASRRRFAQIREALAGEGVAAAAIDSIRNPAGLDINAKAPEEVALSILAEIVQVRRARQGDADALRLGHESVREAKSPPLRIAGESHPAGAVRPATEPHPPEHHSDGSEARDPICGMTVTVAGARHVAEYEGRTYYFCCGGCRQRFLAAPGRYAAEVVSSE
jgi:xanthine dehydrogenase accessory factor